MNNRNLLLKIIKFALIVGSPFMGNRLLAEDLKVCPENSPKAGIDIRNLDNDQYLYIVTEKISIKNASNNESLQEHIASVKLLAAEQFQKYKSGNFQKRRSEYGGFILSATYDTSWDQMKRSLASMKEKYICIQKSSYKDQIFFTGEWSTESEERADRVFAYLEARRELIELSMADPKLDFKKIRTKYPNLFNTDDPKVIKDFINNWKKNRRF